MSIHRGYNLVTGNLGYHTAHQLPAERMPFAAGSTTATDCEPSVPTAASFAHTSSIV